MMLTSTYIMIHVKVVTLGLNPLAIIFNRMV